MGGSIASLEAALDECFPGLFSGIHVLPPFPSSGDRGFAPIDYGSIDPAFGNWDDLRRLSSRYDVMLDLMVNHVSRRSPRFRDFEEKGRASAYAGLFLTMDKIWPSGKIDPEDLSRVALRRPRPFSAYRVGPGKREELLWTTFGAEDPSEQVDVDWRSQEFRLLIEEVLGRFAANGIRTVRLDAVGYLAKRAGSDCFFVEPEIHRAMDIVRGAADPLGIELLPELHAPLRAQAALSARGYATYDFALPYLILEAIQEKSAEGLVPYLAARTAGGVTLIDCHDGLPVKPDLDGLRDSGRERRLVAKCVERGARLSLVKSQAHKDPDGFDVHQVCGTLYSLLGGEDGAFVAARAIQLFAPGVPQVYYAGLLAAENDYAAADASGDPRDLNRPDYSLEGIRAAASKDAVRRLAALIRLRNAHPAFDGRFEAALEGRSRLAMAWSKGAARCVLAADLDALECRVESSGWGGIESLTL